MAASMSRGGIFRETRKRAAVRLLGGEKGRMRF